MKREVLEAKRTSWDRKETRNGNAVVANKLLWTGEDAGGGSHFAPPKRVCKARTGIAYEMEAGLSMM